MGELEIELALRRTEPMVLYLDTRESRQLIRDMESIGVEPWELEQAIHRMRGDVGTPLTPSGILRELKAGKMMRQQRRARGLGGRVAL